MVHCVPAGSQAVSSPSMVVLLIGSIRPILREEIMVSNGTGCKRQKEALSLAFAASPSLRCSPMWVVANKAVLV